MTATRATRPKLALAGRRTPCAALVALFCACGAPPRSTATGQDGERDGGAVSTCAARELAPTLLPGVAPEERTLAYWLGRLGADGDEVVLDPEAVRRHDAAFAALAGPERLGAVDLLAPPDDAALKDEVNQPLGYLQERVQKGELVDAGGAALAASRVAALAPVATLPPLAPEL
ncbi:MAG: hypothetical protein IT373_28770, partial [Polyangiaceae bacterium]|nr:hypothetical protein [Polyangiaceae bacterium]